MSDPDNALLSLLHSGLQPPTGHLQPIHPFITNNTAFSLRPAANALPTFVGFHHGFRCNDLKRVGTLACGQSVNARKWSAVVMNVS